MNTYNLTYKELSIKVCKARKLDADIEYAFALLNAFYKGITHEV